MPNAAYFRALRARRKAEGRPLTSGPSGKHVAPRVRSQPRAPQPGWLDRPVIAWDGEGITPVAQSGMRRADFRRLIEATAREDVATAGYLKTIVDAAIAMEKGIVPPTRHDGIVEEWREVPRRYFRTGVPRFEQLGNADVIAAHAEALGGQPWTGDEIARFLIDHERRTLRAAREAAERQYAHLHPAHGEHRYVLLANSLGESIVSPEGLDTVACLEFLLRTAQKHPNHVHVGFALQYDFEMMLGALSMRQMVALREAQHPFGVVVGKKRYKLTYRPRKYLRVAQGDRTVTIWDTFGFYQQSFLVALKKWLSPAELEAFGVDEIAAMKAKRSTFTFAELADVKRYCNLELAAMVRMTEALRDAHKDAGVPIRSLDGAGATAGAMLLKYGVKAHIEEDPETHRDAIARAYAGGRIEITRIGAFPSIVDSDVRSAYPAAMRELPSLRDTTYHAVREPSGAHPYLAELDWVFPTGLPWYPLFFRTPGGAIRFPRAGSGFYWYPEVELAYEFARRFGGAVFVRSAVELHVARPEKPFAFVDEVWTMRNLWKNQGRAAEKVLKLGMNSLYGKSAQQLGARVTRFKDDAGAWRTRVVAPPFFSLVWAGLITSRTRATLATAGMLDPTAVVMFSTDGLFTTSPVALDYGERLGGWEESRLEEFIVAQPGVYWWRSNATDSGWDVKARGFGLDSLRTPDAIVNAWKTNVSAIDIPTTRFVTSGTACASFESWKRWRKWLEEPRELRIDGESEKRFAARRLPRAGNVPLVSRPAIEWESGNLISAPHDVRHWNNARMTLIGDPSIADDEAEVRDL